MLWRKRAHDVRPWPMADKTDITWHTWPMADVTLRVGLEWERAGWLCDVFPDFLPLPPGRVDRPRPPTSSSVGVRRSGRPAAVVFDANRRVPSVTPAPSSVVGSHPRTSLSPAPSRLLSGRFSFCPDDVSSSPYVMSPSCPSCSGSGPVWRLLRRLVAFCRPPTGLVRGPLLSTRLDTSPCTNRSVCASLSRDTSPWEVTCVDLCFTRPVLSDVSVSDSSPSSVSPRWSTCPGWAVCRPEWPLPPRRHRVSTLDDGLSGRCDTSSSSCLCVTSDTATDRSTDDMSTYDMSTYDMSTDDMSTYDMSTDDMSTDDMSTDDMSTDDMSTYDMSTDDMSTDDMSTYDMSTDDMSTDDMSTDDTSTDRYEHRPIWAQTTGGEVDVMVDTDRHWVYSSSSHSSLLSLLTRWLWIKYC